MVLSKRSGKRNREPLAIMDAPREYNEAKGAKGKDGKGKGAERDDRAKGKAKGKGKKGKGKAKGRR